MNCSKIQNLLSAYMDDELTGEEQLQIRRHLGVCQKCSTEHDTLLATKRMISSLTVRQARPEMEQMIHDVLAEEESNRKRRSPIMAWWLTLPMNRRMQFASIFAVGAVALAVARIAPILLAPPPRIGNLTPVYVASSSEKRGNSTVGLILLNHNPTDNAPASAGGGAVPISVHEFNRSNTP